MLMGCSSGSAQSSREETFWQWFQANDSRLFNFETNQEKVFDELQAELHKVNSGLTFEFGPKENGVRDFVISADGIKDVFPSVISLANAGPTLPHWKIIKFRPRRGLGPISLNGLKLLPEQLDFTIEPDGSKAAITLFIDGYRESEHDRYAGVGFLMLDQALGEYDVEMKVNGIDFKARTAKSKLPKHAFSELAAVFDEFEKDR